MFSDSFETVNIWYFYFARWCDKEKQGWEEWQMNGHEWVLWYLAEPCTGENDGDD